ncbi:PREDICTED: PRUPE_7G010700 [Prunus dulcis]|uniref:PREDICTED: PRUPE_7G010700 n=1 Tax=Prunus dulcis TaxID=3755 RepID=A0A5E4G141_PRUDU|nr:PREDICTED: PRUPE_7G010700 [Prunus dulcis]
MSGHPETLDLFEHCTFAKNLWGCVASLPPISQDNDFLFWLAKLSTNSQDHGLDQLSIGLLANLGCQGIACWFRNVTPHAARCIHIATQIVQGLHGSTGFVIRDCDGHVLSAGEKKIGEVTITVAEGLALCDLLILAIDSGWKKLVVEGDAKLNRDCVEKKAAIK